MHEERAIAPDLDGARILWRHWYADPLAPHEAWVREFSASGLHVRLAATASEDDRGRWFECAQLRVVSVLESRPLHEAKP